MYPGSLEEDVRSSYCAFVILYLLGNQWPAINLEKAIDFLKACQVGFVSTFAEFAVGSPLCHRRTKVLSRKRLG